MQTAANAVFNTHELLERILLELPIIDTLRLRRMNRAWRHIVNTRPALQRKLYYRPTPTKHDATCVPRRADINPLLKTSHPIWSTTKSDPWHLRSITRTAVVDENNTFQLPAIELDFTLNDIYCRRYDHISSYGNRATRGSWRRVLITQTPSARIMARLSNHRSDRYKYINTQWFPASSTLGEVCDWLEKTYMETVGAEEWWKWTSIPQ